MFPHERRQLCNISAYESQIEAFRESRTDSSQVNVVPDEDVKVDEDENAGAKVDEEIDDDIYPGDGPHEPEADIFDTEEHDLHYHNIMVLFGLCEYCNVLISQHYSLVPLDCCNLILSHNRI
jgi:hypothetical protein